ncbi:MAG: hypothetical protein KGP13_11130 [Burkholderiales bacterium]|nr:hypothetical protein [Burkholderiales bacterium]
MIRRRPLLAGLATLVSLKPLLSWAQPATKKLKPKTPPVWTGFGLNGGSAQARYDLTREFVQKKYNHKLDESEAFLFLVEPLKNLLASKQAGRVQFKDKVEFGENLLLGFAHDYETTVGARVEKDGENANTLFIFMSGVGLILSFDNGTGWRVLSSFPFMLRMERPGGDLNDVRGKAVGYMNEAYTAYGNAFSHFLGRFNKWDQGFSSNYFARLTKATIHKDAKDKLAAYRIQNVLNEELVGFSTSSALCDNLDIPLLPFQENDALAKRYAVKFANDLAAQKEISIPDADLKFEVVLRDVDKQVTVSSQKGVNIVKRTVVMRVIVFDEYSSLPDKKILNVLASSTGEDRMPLNTSEDDTPERDLVFFDRLMSRTLTQLFKGLASKNESQLASVEVKLSFVAPALPRLLELCTKTRG